MRCAILRPKVCLDLHDPADAASGAARSGPDEEGAEERGGGLDG
jgi:hypothetical protein